MVLTKVGHSVFQECVLFVLLKNYGKSMTADELLINCCDTALGDLTVGKIGNDLGGLIEENLIEEETSHTKIMLNDGKKPMYKINAGGILYVRKKLIKPVLDLIQRDDYQKILAQTSTSEHVIDTIGRFHDEVTQPNEEIDKQTFSSKLVDFATNNIAPVIELINNVLKLSPTHSV